MREDGIFNEAWHGQRIGHYEGTPMSEDANVKIIGCDWTSFERVS